MTPASRPEPAAPATRGPDLVAWAIVGVALALRLFHLGHESLWIDEIHSLLTSRLDAVDVVRTVAADQHPPLYFLGLRYWALLAGQSEFAMRLPSAIVGTLVVACTWWLGTLLYDRKAGRVAAAIVALSTFHVHYSQEARAYALLALLSALSYAFLWKWLRRPSPALAAGYLLSSFGMLYAHNYGLFTVVAQNAGVVGVAGVAWLRRRDGPRVLRRWLVMQAILAVGYVPWIGVLVRQLRFTIEERPAPPPPWSKLVGPFLTYSGFRALFPVLALLAGLAVAHAVVRRTAAGGARWPFVGEPAADRAVVLASWLAVPLVVPFVLSHLVTPIYLTRYTIASSLAFYLLAARGLAILPAPGWRRLAVASIVLFSAAGLWNYYHAVNKEPWREVARYVDDHARAGDTVVFDAPFIEKSFDHYSRREDLREIAAPPDDAPDDDLRRWVSDLGAFSRIWLVEAYNRNDRVRRALLEAFRPGRPPRPEDDRRYPSESYAIGKRVTIELLLLHPIAD